MRPRPLTRRARDLVRFNAYASFACAVLVLAVVLPPGGTGIPRLALAGLAAALALAGADELSLAVGRRLRRWHVVPFALLNAVGAAACIAVLASADGLPGGSRFVVGLAALTFGAFAVLETNASRSL